MSSPPIQWPARAALAALVTLAALAAHPTWARSLGVDVWNLPALQRQMRGVTDERARLDSARDDARRRGAARRAITADLVAGRITPAEAVARFTQGLVPPDQLAYLRHKYPTDTDEELVARVVIGAALEHVAPEDREGAEHRWEGELRQVVAAR
jgi:hypothetical protein